jgi:hypothetical protein
MIAAFVQLDILGSVTVLRTPLGLTFPLPQAFPGMVLLFCVCAPYQAAFYILAKNMPPGCQPSRDYCLQCHFCASTANVHQPLFLQCCLMSPAAAALASLLGFLWVPLI